jgi:hypothetical protein
MCNIKGKGINIGEDLEMEIAEYVIVFHLLIKNIEILFLVIFIRMDLQFIHINLEQNKALVSLCLLCST